MTNVGRLSTEAALAATSRIAVVVAIDEAGARLIDFQGSPSGLLGIGPHEFRQDAHDVRARVERALGEALLGRAPLTPYSDLAAAFDCIDRLGRVRRLALEGRVEVDRNREGGLRVVGVLGLANVDEDARKGQESLMQILRLSEIALFAPTIQGGLQEASEAIADGEVFLAASIGLVNNDNGALDFVASAGCADDRRVRLELQRVATRAWSAGDPIVETWPGAPHQRAVCVTMTVDGDAVGVLALRFEPRALHNKGLGEELIATFATYLSSLVSRASRALEPMQEDDPDLRAKLDSLTRRPAEVLFEIVERGGSNAELGERLGVAANTIKVHCREVYKALNVKSRAEATALVVKSASNWLAAQRQRSQPDTR